MRQHNGSDKRRVLISQLRFSASRLLSSLSHRTAVTCVTSSLPQVSKQLVLVALARKVPSPVAVQGDIRPAKSPSAVSSSRTGCFDLALDSLMSHASLRTMILSSEHCGECSFRSILASWSACTILFSSTDQGYASAACDQNEALTAPGRGYE